MGERPYIVRATGPGAADVVDRATGERRGHVRRWRDGRWREWYGDCDARWPCSSQTHPTRAKAAAAVWEASRG